MTDPTHRSSRRQHQRVPRVADAQRIHIADQYRRLHVERPSSRASSGSSARGSATRLVPDPDHPEGDEAPPAQRHVLQLVRRGHRRTCSPCGRTTGTTVYPFVSSVDNGWFAASLMVVRDAEPEASQRWRTRSERMSFDMFFDTEARAPRRPACTEVSGTSSPRRPGSSCRATTSGIGPDVCYTPTTTTPSCPSPGSRPTSASPAARSRRAAYFATCGRSRDDWDWQEQKPVGDHRTYFGIDVFEGAYTYRGMHIVPSWGGDMFEALDARPVRPGGHAGRHGPGAVNHPLTFAPSASSGWTTPSTATGGSHRPATRPADTASMGWSRSA